MITEDFRYAVHNSNGSSNLSSGWTTLPKSTAFGPAAHISGWGCPSVRYFSPYYYVIGGGHVVQLGRSKDLMKWEMATPELGSGFSSDFIRPSERDNLTASSVMRTAAQNHLSAGRTSEPHDIGDGPSVPNRTKWDLDANDADFCCDLPPSAGGPTESWVLWGCDSQGQFADPKRCPDCGPEGYACIGTASVTLQALLDSYFLKLDDEHASTDYEIHERSESSPVQDDPCRSNSDCSLNGLCAASSGACVCDVGYTGRRCELFDLLPEGSAFHSPDIEKMPTRRATRSGNPGPLLPPDSATLKGKRNVLIIGDSISLGQMSRLQSILAADGYILQHGPSAEAGGAIDIKHAVNNLQEFIFTADMQPARYDAVSFNFGVHDADYSCTKGPKGFRGLVCFPDEYTPLAQYTTMLASLKHTLLTVVPKPSRLVFALSTPICYNVTLNERILAFNNAARQVMAAAPPVAVHDTYSVITDVCGQPPYNAPYASPSGPNCSIANYGNVHYQPSGWALLANTTATAIRALFDDGGRAGGKGAGLAALATSGGAGRGNNITHCPTDAKEPTACPGSPEISSCVRSNISRTGYACCVGAGPGAAPCGDSYHCCPNNTRCVAGDGDVCSFGGRVEGHYSGPGVGGCFCKSL
jgi:hypothetical protein